MNGIKEELNKWRDIPCSWIGSLNIFKISVLPNLIYRFNIILVKTLLNYFIDIDKVILKFVWKSKRPSATKTILKKNKVGGLTLPNFKIATVPEATVHKTVEWNKF